MQVNVRLSAGLAQITQTARLQVTLPEDATVADVAGQLVDQYPGLQVRLGHAVAMLGGTHVPRTASLVPGQEVAFLLPVAGGS
jgi:molybdopterin converting factor small subunit